MDRSVDSIGTCSLDLDASAEMPDLAENSSVRTLCSASLRTPSAQEIRLPSYLSLACTVNGYSTTTNYDPERLTKSRDSSPHRPQHSQDNVTYAIHNNLLSPPNLVPLPMQKIKRQPNMSEQTYFTSSKSVTYTNKENLIISKDVVDDGKYRNGQIKSQTNGDCKSFIQQRVERLYGPGALAQGFFVMKRRKGQNSECEVERIKLECDKHSKSMSDKLMVDDVNESVMKQSTSSPSLPVLRHLTAEFRAQLPTFCTRKGCEGTIQKSNTEPALKDGVNGHLKNSNSKISFNGCHANNSINENCFLDEGVKDGHYFLKLLEKETQHLLALAEIAERELQNDGLSEDTKGFLRSASGKARLLVSQKLQQFKGLCTNNLTQVQGDAYPTTNEDLQGFWDMVNLQVDQINNLYKELEVLKANNWVETTYSNGNSKDTVDKSNTTKPRRCAVPRAQSAGAEEARKKREAQRKQMLEERRKAMRKQKELPEQNIEIYVPESTS